MPRIGEMFWMSLETPVLFLIFNRPDTTSQVFEEIRRVRPRKLFVASDGPRPNVTGEKDACQRSRQLATKVDWPCDLQVLFRDTNLGCKMAVSSAISWFFQQVTEGIILEDDCIPHPTFFHFCQTILERYRFDDRVMHISGANFQFGRKRGDASYYFSRFCHVWGWASWRRAWSHYDVDMSQWKSAKNKKTYSESFKTRSEWSFFRRSWDLVSNGQIDTWDYQWVFACITRKSLNVVSNVNLIKNIGFGACSTHTRRISPVANIPAVGIQFPLNHPDEYAWDEDADFHTSQLFFRCGFISSLASGIRRMLDRLFAKNCCRVKRCP